MKSIILISSIFWIVFGVIYLLLFNEDARSAIGIACLFLLPGLVLYKEGSN